MSRRGSGGALSIVLSLVFVLLCGGVFFLVATGRLSGLGVGPTQSADSPSAGSAAGSVQPKDFGAYTWDELAEVAQLIEQAASEEEGLAIARDYGILSSDDGNLNDCVRQVLLGDGSVALCRVVGVLADEKSDGSGKAGLTFILSGLGSSEMNSTDTCEGGWGSSGLRTWLNSDGVSLLPDELRGHVAEVSKSTNNVGITGDPGDVTATSDFLWLFSASEIYGNLTWFEQEYGDGAGYHTDYTDFAPYTQMINSEGSQYLYFAQNGVADRSEYAAVAEALGGLASNFWLRTAYPLAIGDDAGQFYQVMASGYPSTVAVASQKNLIIAGFCL